MIFFKLSPRDVDHVYYDSDASVDFKEIDEFRKFCNNSWEKPYGYIVIDKDNQDLKNRYRNQLELVETPVEIMKSVQSQEVKKPEEKHRATKKCEICNIEILSSSHARHVKSKAHLKKLS